LHAPASECQDRQIPSSMSGAIMPLTRWKLHGADQAGAPDCSRLDFPTFLATPHGASFSPAKCSTRPARPWGSGRDTRRLEPSPFRALSLLCSSGERPSPTPETTGSRRFSYSIGICVSSKRHYAGLARDVRYE
jgi:hypothetical protein